MGSKLLKLIVKIGLGCLIVFVLLFWLLTSKGSVEHSAVVSQDVVDAHSLITGTLDELRHTPGGISVQLDQHRLDALLSVASHTLKPLTFQGAILESSLLLHAVVELPGVFQGRLLHGYCWLSRQASEFTFDSCQLGKVPISGRLAQFFLGFGTKLLLEPPSDKQLLTLFGHGKVSDHTLFFIQPDADAIRPQLAKRVYRGRQFSREVFGESQGQAPEVAVYLHALKQLADQYPEERRLSFFLQKMLIKAELNASGKNPDKEYRTALWALAVGFGNRSFVRYANSALTQDDVPLLPPVLLAGRRDLTLHFLYSAVIKMVGNAHIAEQIGHLKELHDASAGGTGFSFVDIAANKAGMWFVQHLTSIQIELAYQLDAEEFEMTFMLPLHDLPEGIPETRFQQQYGGLNGEGTLRLFDMMDSRLARLSLFSAK